jgi:homoserine O-acetyltransferase
MTMFRQIAFATAAVTAGSGAQAADAGSGVSTGAQSDPSSAATPHQADATFANYRFRDGETLPQLRLHYATLGQPHRNAQGAINNAVLLLHWTGASGEALLTPKYRTALFAPGAPFDASRYFVILPMVANDAVL